MIFAFSLLIELPGWAAATLRSIRSFRRRGAGTRDFRVTGGYGISDPPEFTESIRPSAGKLDDLAPLLGFFGDELPELSWRATSTARAKLDDPCLYLGVSEAGVDLPVEFVNDSAGVFLGAPMPNQRRLETRQEITHRRRRRGAPPSAPWWSPRDGRSLPALMCSMMGMLSNMTLHLSAEQVSRAGAAPRYGTWTMSTPAIILNSSPVTWLRGPVAGRRHVDLARIGLGIGDEFGNRLGRNRGFTSMT